MRTPRGVRGRAPTVGAWFRAWGMALSRLRCRRGAAWVWSRPCPHVGCGLVPTPCPSPAGVGALLLPDGGPPKRAGAGGYRGDVACLDGETGRRDRVGVGA